MDAGDNGDWIKIVHYQQFAKVSEFLADFASPGPWDELKLMLADFMRLPASKGLRPRVRRQLLDLGLIEMAGDPS